MIFLPIPKRHPHTDIWYHFDPTFQHTMHFTNNETNAIQTMDRGGVLKLHFLKNFPEIISYCRKLRF